MRLLFRLVAADDRSLDEVVFLFVFIDFVLETGLYCGEFSFEGVYIVSEFLSLYFELNTEVFGGGL